MTLEYGKGTSADIPAIFAQAKALVDAYEDVSSIALYRWFGFVTAEAVGNTRQIMRREEQP